MAQQTRRSGFTLVEIMVVAAILGLIGLTLMALSTAGPRVAMQSTALFGSIVDTQRVLDRLREDLKNASAATLNCAPAAPDDLVFSQQNTPIAYDHDGSLLRRNGAVVASGITGFLPACFPDGRVRLEVAVQVNSNMTRTLVSQVWVRNP